MHGTMLKFCGMSIKIQKRNKRILTSICVLFILTSLVLSLPVTAHQGNTDSKGGHYDHSTGQYHYHHGYPAHQHPKGVCPYISSSNSNGSSNSDEEENVFLTILTCLVLGVGVFVACIVLPLAWVGIENKIKNRNKEKQEQSKKRIPVIAETDAAKPPIPEMASILYSYFFSYMRSNPEHMEQSANIFGNAIHIAKSLSPDAINKSIQNSGSLELSALNLLTNCAASKIQPCSSEENDNDGAYHLFRWVNKEKLKKGLISQSKYEENECLAMKLKKGET